MVSRICDMRIMYLRPTVSGVYIRNVRVICVLCVYVICVMCAWDWGTQRNFVFFGGDTVTFRL